MKLCFKLFIGVFFVLTLTGCIGENYDFTPPKVSIMNAYDISDEEELEAANINWNTDKKYTKETKDILSFARNKNYYLMILENKWKYYLTVKILQSKS